MKRILTATVAAAALILAGCATNTVDTAGQSQTRTKVASTQSGKKTLAYAGNVKLSRKLKSEQEQQKVLFPSDPNAAETLRKTTGVVSPQRPDAQSIVRADPMPKSVEGESLAGKRVKAGSEIWIDGKKYRVVKSGTFKGKAARVMSASASKRVIFETPRTASVSKKVRATTKSARLAPKKARFGYSAPKTSRPAGGGYSGGGGYQSAVARYARAYGVPVSLAQAVVRVESGGRANARGGAGEIGLMQIKPATARMMGYRGSARGLYNPDTNLKYGMKYLAQAHKLGGRSVCGTILKYNAGHGARRMNPISARYCSKVKRILRS